VALNRVARRFYDRAVDIDMTPALRLLNSILPPKLAAGALAVVYAGLIIAIMTLIDFEPDRIIRYLDAH
jgi:hypothetical protein